MDRLEIDSCLLGWESDRSGAMLEVESCAGAQALPASRTAFRLTAMGRRIGIGIAFLPTSRVIDVSIQPGVFEAVLPIDSGSCQPGTCGSIVANWITGLAEIASAWRPSDPDVAGLVGTAGGAAFPLLGAVYDQGAAALKAIPRWATPALRLPTAREAALAAFG